MIDDGKQWAPGARRGVTFSRDVFSFIFKNETPSLLSSLECRRKGDTAEALLSNIR